MSIKIALGAGSDDPRWRSSGALRKEWMRRGFAEDNPVDAEIVFNFIDPGRPQPFRRRQRSTYVAIVSVLGARRTTCCGTSTR